MRSLVVGLVACALSPLAVGQTSIRKVDFKNFSYPLRDHLLGHAELKWLSVAGNAGPHLGMVRLRNGTDLAGFELEKVSYADLIRNGKEGAIVVLRYDTGGTQTTNYVYFYSLENGKPKLLAYCHTGDRAYSGLYGVYGNHGALVIELLTRVSDREIAVPRASYADGIAGMEAALSRLVPRSTWC